MIRVITIAVTFGFTMSMLLNKPTHVVGFPEVGRYAVGIMGLAVVMKLCGIPDEQIERMLFISLPFGAGVAAARVFGVQ